MDEIRARIAEGQSPTRIARETGVSRGAVYKAKGKTGEHGKAAQGPSEVRDNPVP
ncbi:MAG: helix-turn-helix domain-containing protein [Boseongicola sp.]|nr:helix-turn-helix domain-containing protein [Boseongicola sp.]